MDNDELRLECLRLAADPAKGHDGVMERARLYIKFVLWDDAARENSLSSRWQKIEGK